MHFCGAETENGVWLHTCSSSSSSTLHTHLLLRIDIMTQMHGRVACSTPQTHGARSWSSIGSPLLQCEGRFCHFLWNGAQQRDPAVHELWKIKANFCVCVVDWKSIRNIIRGTQEYVFSRNAAQYGCHQRANWNFLGCMKIGFR
jgi:hypothetical protein